VDAAPVPVGAGFAAGAVAKKDVTADEAMFDSHLDDALRGRRFDVLAPETATEVP